MIAEPDLLDQRCSNLCLSLFAELARRGHTVMPKYGGFEITFANGESLDLDLRERFSRQRRPLVVGKLQPYPLTPPTARWQTVAAGQLTLIATQSRSRKRSWSDARRPLETQLDAIVEGLENIAVQAAENRAQNERWRRLWAGAEERVRQRRQRNRKTAACWDGFRQLAVDWEEAARLRAFTAALAKRVAAIEDPPEEAVDCLAWVRKRIRALDPLLNELGEIFELFDDLELNVAEEELTDEEMEFDRMVSGSTWQGNDRRA